jgi:hypothetical protein
MEEGKGMNCKFRIVNCKFLLTQREKGACGESHGVFSKKIIFTQRSLLDLGDLCVKEASQSEIYNPKLEIL